MKKIGITLVVVIIAIASILMLRSNATAPTTMSTQNQNQKQNQNQPTASQTVTLTSNGFNPQVVTIKVGGKVTWVNKSGQTFSLASDVHPTHLLYPALNVGEVQNGTSVSVTFDKAGSHGYHDHYNPSQTGTVVVQ